MNTIDIKYNSEYGELSNFSPHPFQMDGVSIASMEGFLQGLKFKSIKRQHNTFAMSDYRAKRVGRRGVRWRFGSQLYYNGKRIDRFSNEYTQLISRAYDSMAEQNEAFRNTLISTNQRTLEHSIGKDDKHKTVLTSTEFINQLNRLRDKYNTKN